MRINMLEVLLVLIVATKLTAFHITHNFGIMLFFITFIVGIYGYIKEKANNERMFGAEPIKKNKKKAIYFSSDDNRQQANYYEDIVTEHLAQESIKEHYRHQEEMEEIQEDPQSIHRSEQLEYHNDFNDERYNDDYGDDYHDGYYDDSNGDNY